MPRFSTRRTRSTAASPVCTKCCGARDCWKESGASTRRKDCRQDRRKRSTGFTEPTPTSTTTSSSRSTATSGCVRKIICKCLAPAKTATWEPVYSHKWSSTLTIEIYFQAPWLSATAPDVKTRKLPLSKLTSLDDHIHGTLAIVVGGKPLPMLGYFGPSDACLGDWAAELSRAARVLSSGDPASYVYDEGEQGQPAFVFQRKGETVSL